MQRLVSASRSTKTSSLQVGQPTSADNHKGPKQSFIIDNFGLHYYCQYHIQILSIFHLICEYTNLLHYISWHKHTFLASHTTVVDHKHHIGTFSHTSSAILCWLHHCFCRVVGYILLVVHRSAMLHFNIRTIEETNSCCI